MTPLPHIVCLQEVETSSLRSTLAFRPDRPEETQLESFMAELERAFDELDRPFPYEAFYFRAHANRIGTRALSTMGLAVVVDTNALRVDRHNASDPHRITHHHVRRFKDRKQARICAHLRVTDRHGRPLHVFNTHLSLPTPFAKEFWTGPERIGFGINQPPQYAAALRSCMIEALCEPRTSSASARHSSICSPTGAAGCAIASGSPFTPAELPPT